MEVKAGRLFKAPGTNNVVPDPKQGVLLVTRTPISIKLCWRDTLTGKIEDLATCLPGEVEVKTVPSRRSFVLSWTKSTQRLFFWHQDRPERDSEDIHMLQGALTDPLVSPPPAMPPPFSLSPEDALTNALLGVAPPASSSSGGPNSYAANLAALQSLAAAIQLPPDMALEEDLELTSVVVPSKVIDIMTRRPEIAQALYQFLPEEERNLKGLGELLRSPQLAQTMDVLQYAIRSGQVASMLIEFKLDPTAQGPLGVKKFLQALVRQGKAKKP
ncbi:26S proteasome regulatory subunit N13 [Pelomyxa schiedti]|nr:26S proteasome regulatory subunit N13 [Pelomyxa schiedti]